MFEKYNEALAINLGSGFRVGPHSSMLEKHLEYYQNVNFLIRDGLCDKTSCNTHSFKILNKYGFKVNNSLQKVLDMWIYPMIFQGSDQYNKVMKITDKTFFMHYGNLSWFTK